MNRWVLLVVVAGAAFLSTGCRTARYSGVYAAEEVMASDMPMGNRYATEPDAGKPVSVEFTTNTSGRIVIYRAEFNLTVENIRGTLESLKAMALSLQGYMQEMKQESILLRVPAMKLNEAIQQVEKMGDVTQREIVGEDVTEEMMDLDIRLRNVNEMRTRLYALLNKGTNVQDLLMIEKELERVTASIELIKGRMQFLHNSTAYSSLRVTLNSPLPQERLIEAMPFEWIRPLGAEIMLGQSTRFFPDSWPRTKVRLEWPSEFVKVRQERDVVRAMSGDGVTILVKRHENFENASLAFWVPMVRRWLPSANVLALGEEKELTGEDGVRGRLFAAGRTIGSVKYQYLLAVFAGEEHVYTYEVWGPADLVSDGREEIERSMLTVEVD